MSVSETNRSHEAVEPSQTKRTQRNKAALNWSRELRRFDYAGGRRPASETLQRTTRFLRIAFSWMKL